MTLTERLAKFFRERLGEWIDGRVLALIAGTYAWRTQVSRLRRTPFHMNVENRQRRISRPNGTRITISEYRFSPSAPSPSVGVPIRRAVCECGGSGFESIFVDGVERLRRCACRSGASEVSR